MALMFCSALVFFCLISVRVKAQLNVCALDLHGVSYSTDIEFSTASFPNEVPAVVGNPLALRCVVTVTETTMLFNPQITSYIWSRGGTILRQYTQETLQIQALASVDGGEYTCRAQTNVSCVTVESDITTVTTQPSVTVSPSSDFAVNEGQRVQIVCSVQGWPTPTIEWTRSTRDNTVLTISTNPVLILSSSSVSDSGDYTCIAENNRGTSRATITITVNEVTDLPTQPTTAPQPITTSQPSVGNSNMQGAIPKPEPETGFYVGIAVTAFVCLALTIFVIVAVIVWSVRKSKSPQQHEEGGEEGEGEVL